jgi:hypothetical protein
LVAYNVKVLLQVGDFITSRWNCRLALFDGENKNFCLALFVKPITAAAK